MKWKLKLNFIVISVFFFVALMMSNFICVEHMIVIRVIFVQVCKFCGWNLEMYVGLSG